MTIFRPSTLIAFLAVCHAAAGLCCLAREAVVENPAQLMAVLPRAGAGDTIILKKGLWRDARIVISRGGLDGRPLTIRAETPGETLLGGESGLLIDAPYVTIDGLAFYQGSIGKGAVIEFTSHHGIVQNTAILDYNPASFESECYWVLFNGHHNLLDRCYFKGKNNRGPLVGNAREGSRHNTVSRCYFKNVPYNIGNGREIIRVWGYGQNDELGSDGGFFTIENNLFDHADGEGGEIISLKSNRNIVRRNTVIATRGCVNIRRGSFNTVEENIILGQGAEGAHGLRMSGQSNVVARNFVSGCDYGIMITSGEYIDAFLTPEFRPHAAEEVSGQANGRTATYPQVKNLTLAENVLVGNSQSDLEVGSYYLDDWPRSQMVLLPEDSVITDNRFVRPEKGASVVGATPKRDPLLDKFTFKPNRYSGNVVVGGKIKFDPAGSGFKVEPLPSGWRPEQEKMPGNPLSPGDVGPAWVIALRKAGKFPVEDSTDCNRPLNEITKKEAKEAKKQTEGKNSNPEKQGKKARSKKG